MIQLYAEITAAFGWGIGELEHRPLDELLHIWGQAVEILEERNRQTQAAFRQKK